MIIFLPDGPAHEIIDDQTCEVHSETFGTLSGHKNEPDLHTTDREDWCGIITQNEVTQNSRFLDICIIIFANFYTCTSKSKHRNII